MTNSALAPREPEFNNCYMYLYNSDTAKVTFMSCNNFKIHLQAQLQNKMT